MVAAAAVAAWATSDRTHIRFSRSLQGPLHRPIRSVAVGDPGIGGNIVCRHCADVHALWHKLHVGLRSDDFAAFSNLEVAVRQTHCATQEAATEAAAAH